VAKAARPFKPGAGALFPSALEMEGLTLGDPLADRSVGPLHDFLLSLLGVAGQVATPTPRTGWRDYATALRSAFVAAPERALYFRGLEADGTPRVTAHGARALLNEARAAAFLFSGRKRVIVTVPLTHSFGFVFGLLAPRLLKIPALDANPFPRLADCPLEKGDLLVLFPQLLKKLAVVPPPDVSLLCSASPPLDDRFFQTARHVGFLSLAEVYGVSVTGALGYRKSAGPYELFPHFQRDGERGALRIDTGARLVSRRLVWRKERHFSHFGAGGAGAP
jgi:hypothetical protein